MSLPRDPAPVESVLAGMTATPHTDAERPRPAAAAPGTGGAVEPDEPDLADEEPADLYLPGYPTSPGHPDSDGDGITDAYELLNLGTDAFATDSDADGVADDVEVVLGFDPTATDAPLGGDVADLDNDLPTPDPDDVLGGIDDDADFGATGTADGDGPPDAD